MTPRHALPFLALGLSACGIFFSNRFDEFTDTALLICTLTVSERVDVTTGWTGGELVRAKASQGIQPLTTTWPDGTTAELELEVDVDLTDVHHEAYEPIDPDDTDAWCANGAEDTWRTSATVALRLGDDIVIEWGGPVDLSDSTHTYGMSFDLEQLGPHLARLTPAQQQAHTGRIDFTWTADKLGQIEGAGSMTVSVRNEGTEGMADTATGVMRDETLLALISGP